MPVSGIVLTCEAERADAIAVQIAALTGVEVHGVLPDGRIVAVVESDTVDGEVVLVSGLQEIDGVVSVQMAYHNFEDVEAEQP
jgi:periplasmic nitrate reductase NapD